MLQGVLTGYSQGLLHAARSVRRRQRVDGADDRRGRRQDLRRAVGVADQDDLRAGVGVSV